MANKTGNFDGKRAVRRELRKMFILANKYLYGGSRIKKNRTARLPTKTIEMIQYGKIPFKLITRFGELTKREIIVIALLYAHRNDKTGRCNPGRSLLIEESGIAKTHMSTTLKSLESKEWIAEDPHGNFHLFNSHQIDERCRNKNRKVTESVTPSYQIGNQKLPNRELKVTESVTESYQIGNSHIKEYEQLIEQRKEQDIYITREEKVSASNHLEPDLSSAVNEDLAQEIEETLAWLREKKNLRRLPVHEWTQLFADLDFERIPLNDFKQFYTFVEKQPWVTTVSPRLLRTQIEAWKNRDVIEAKQKIHNGGTSKNGTNRSNNGKLGNSKSEQWDQTVSEYERLYEQYDAQSAAFENPH